MHFFHFQNSLFLYANFQTLCQGRERAGALYY